MFLAGCGEAAADEFQGALCHLLSQVSGGASYQIKYDALGRAVARTLSGQTTFYYYDGEKAIQETGATLASNIYGLEVDEIVVRFEPGLLRYFYQDHEGSVTHVIGNANALLETYRYDAFGQPFIRDGNNRPLTTSGINNRFMFTGREWAPANLGFYEYRARAYQPVLGRFMSEDPKSFDAGDYNLFRYCGNDPGDHVDPTGLLTEFDAGIRKQEGQTTSDNSMYGSDFYHSGIYMGYLGKSRSDAVHVDKVQTQTETVRINGKDLKIYHDWRNPGDRKAREAFADAKADHMEYGGEVGQRRDGSQTFVISDPHPTKAQVVNDKYEKGFRQAFIPEPKNVTNNDYKMIGFYYAHWRGHDPKVPAVDQQRAFDNHWHAILATPDNHTGSSQPLLRYYVYPRTPDAL